MTCMGAQRILKFSQIGPSTAELATLERLKNPHRLIMEKWCCHFFSAFLDRIHFILAGNDDIHQSFDKFKIWPDPTTSSHGNRSHNGKTGVATFSRLFFIRSFSYLQVMMT